MDQIIFDNIRAHYEAVQQEVEAKRKATIEQVYSSYPDLKDIDEKIKNIGMSSLEAVLKGNYNNDVEDKITALSKKRLKFIQDNDIDIEFDKPKYQCTKCNDTGIYNNQHCECFNSLLKLEVLKIANFDEGIKKYNFDNFDLNYYSEEIIEGTSISYRQYMESILNTAKKYALNQIDVNNLLLYGDSSSGKTIISSCIANEFLDKLRSVLYIRSTRLMMIYEDYKFRRDEQNDSNVFIDRAYDCDLLIIDDLGNEVINQKTYSYQLMFDLISERINKGQHTILISEMTFDEIKEKYGERLFNKIINNYETIKFINN